MAGDLTIDVPVFNEMFTGLAKLRPQLEENFDVCEYTIVVLKPIVTLPELIHKIVPKRLTDFACPTSSR